MKKYVIVMAVLVAMFALPTALRAQETDPAAVLSALADALNAGDVDGMMELVADDAVLTFVPDLTGAGPISGREQIRAWYESLVATNTRVEPSNLQTAGDKVTWSNKVWTDDFRALGIAPVEFTAEGIVQGGKIKSYTETMTTESLAKFQTAMAALPQSGGNVFPTHAFVTALGALAVLGGLLLRKMSIRAR